MVCNLDSDVIMTRGDFRYHCASDRVKVVTFICVALLAEAGGTCPPLFRATEAMQTHEYYDIGVATMGAPEAGAPLCFLVFT